ncbi:MAG: hypothetical protein HY584_03780 [Candidatus Omnitrophica bacterium]|nr:hypothetical protein [Candidatus Omnitrophota bacterium]
MGKGTVKGFLLNLLVIISLFVTPSCLFAASYDEWVRRGTEAATQLAQGNTQGALGQAVPAYSGQPFHETYVNAGSGGANLQQGIPGLSRFNTRYLGFDGSYNLRSNYGLSQFPSFSNNAQVSARNPLFTNTTSFTPRLRRND